MTSRIYYTIAEAVKAAGYPEGNIPALEHVSEVAGLGPFRLTTGYIHADRPGKTWIKIAYGAANGFVDEADARAAIGVFAPAVELSTERPGTWRFNLPVGGSKGGAQIRHNVQNVVAEQCPGCYMSMPVSGRCDTCS